MSEIKNARIKEISLGFEDHGIFTFDILIEWSCCVTCYGGYALDEYSGEKKHRVGRAESIECLERILETVGVEKWEELPGQYIRIVEVGLGDKITTIGNIMEDRWFDIEDFFENAKKEREESQR